MRIDHDFEAKFASKFQNFEKIKIFWILIHKIKNHLKK